MNSRPLLDTFTIPRTIAITRAAVGAGLMLALSLTARLYMGDEARRPSVQFVNRVFGGRDVALAAVLFSALAQGERPAVSKALWLGAVCDLWDGTSAIIGRGQLPRAGRLLISVNALSWAGIGAAAAVGSRQD
jgi:Domain of unknown function (DUF4267)